MTTWPRSALFRTRTMENSNQRFPSIDRLNERLIRTSRDLRSLGRRLRKERLTIVTTNGCFDLLHAGHLWILSEAKRQGDVLIVGMNSDRSVRKLKGKLRPLTPQEERAEILLALEWVDYVALFHERECNQFILRVCPDVHVNDDSYGVDCVEAPAVREVGARLHLVPKLSTSSTTDLVSRIVEASSV